MTSSDWLESARVWPLAFAQVREDPFIDQAVANRLPPNSRVMMIASGGCTATWLARHPKLRELILVDTNPAQLALTRIKHKLLVEYFPATRLGILGHAPMNEDERRRHLLELLAHESLSSDIFGALGKVAVLGPDYCGRYERLFAALQTAISADDHLSSKLDELLHAESIESQAEWLTAHTTCWQQLEVIFADIFALPNLVALFGANATQNQAQAFSNHFLERLRLHIQRRPMRHNPYVWQMLCGKFPSTSRTPWLDLPPGPLSTTQRYVASPISTVMNETTTLGKQYQMVHLSNALDWLNQSDALTTLRAAWNCTAPGGWLVIRQLNSDLDIRTLGTHIGWQWETDISDDALATDRSFFYRSIHIARKP